MEKQEFVEAIESIKTAHDFDGPTEWIDYMHSVVQYYITNHSKTTIAGTVNGQQFMRSSKDIILNKPTFEDKERYILLIQSYDAIVSRDDLRQYYNLTKTNANN